MNVRSVQRSTALRADAADVWRHATSMAGANHEMAPWLHMTVPPEVEGVGLDDPRVVLGEALFVSRVMFLGVVPVERMRVTIVELERGRRFVEQSPTLGARLWRHERTIDPEGAGCRLTDRLSFAAPLNVMSPVMQLAIAAFFAHRHRRLIALFGAA